MPPSLEPTGWSSMAALNRESANARDRPLSCQSVYRLQDGDRRADFVRSPY
ncbi:hypothetical protein [Leptolyngbya sp. O-77]|uniref:hypothetical protein n=1 Tax=Leptolyngbya sp. O-77 TaxID=1080068 RepID=UPI0015601D90|nr:hypothetical protein [Leptolyngbya sp. O-77]